MNFTSPLPVPANAVPLTADEQKRIRKYLDRIEAHQRQQDAARESLNDICLSIAARAGQTETNFALSADLGCLIPKEK